MLRHQKYCVMMAGKKHSDVRAPIMYDIELIMSAILRKTMIRKGKNSEIYKHQVCANDKDAPQ